MPKNLKQFAGFVAIVAGTFIVINTGRRNFMLFDQVFSGIKLTR